MAKLFGPALSVDAKKTLGKAMTFQGRPSGPAVMKPPIPSLKSRKNPTASQQTQRNKIKSYVAGWQ